MTDKLKICVYAISKNEEQFVSRFYESVKDADLILLADTGSFDSTVELSRKCGITVYEINVTPWRFDTARNTALSLIPKDYDVCISIDLDEELQPGWREELERVWQKDKTNRMRYQYDWGSNVIFYSEKIHARHGFQWENMCHEILITDPRITEEWANTDMLLVIHNPDPNKSRSQYLDLLKADIKLNPCNARNAFYYVRELLFHNRWAEAITAGELYLKISSDTWADERSYALRVIGESYDHLGKDREALDAFRKACNEAPYIREPWVALANSCYLKGIWNECFYAATQALSITNRVLVYTANPEVWGSKPYDLAALACWNLGFKEKAIEYGTQSVKLDPTNLRLIDNLEWYNGNKI